MAPKGGYHGHRQADQALHGDSDQSADHANERAQASFIAQVAEARRAVEEIPYEGILAGEIPGWRCWRTVLTAAGWRLRSASMDKIWEPGVPMIGDVNGSSPPVGSAVTIPHGVYAFKERQAAMDMALVGAGVGYAIAMGAVALWGEIHEHETGYRAENAAVKSLTVVGYAHLKLTQVKRDLSAYTGQCDVEVLPE